MCRQEVERQETNASTVAAYIADAFPELEAYHPTRYQGVVLVLKRGGKAIGQVDFHSYSRISRVSGTGEEDGFFNELASKLEKKFNFIDNVDGTVNCGAIRYYFAEVDENLLK